MKNKLKITLAMSVLLTGCGVFFNDQDDTSPTPPDNEDEEEIIDDQDQDEEDQITQDLESWFPRFENKVYYYEGVNNEFAELIITPQFNQDDFFQITTNNGGTTVADVYEYAEDEIIRVFSRPETYFRDNFLDIGIITEFEDEEIILKQPIAEGTKWENEDRQFEITAVEKEISVPAGTYTTIEVTEEADEMTIKRYYAEDIGLVHEISETEEMTIESKLENIEEQAEEMHVNVFIADDQAEYLNRYETKIELDTNDPARFAIEDLLNGKNEDYPDAQILPEDTKINHMFLNNEEVVEIDLSKEFEENMHAGSTGELFTVYGLVNTIAEYYGVNEVLMTIDGDPYEGGHMLLRKDETLSFDQEMVNE